MIGSLAKMVAYNKAPRTTFTVLHPRKALRLRAMRQELRRSPLPRLAAVSAAALALPLGVALGRATSGRRAEQTA